MRADGNVRTDAPAMLLTSARLAELPGIAHGFFTRQGGVSAGVYASLNGGLGSNDARERVVENRARMAQAIGVAADRLVSLYQIHSPDVIMVRGPWGEGARPKADALVTREPGLALGISTADCGPLLFADAEARVIGAAHAGWKGALSGVVEATLAAMEREGAARSRIRVALGPMISRKAYEVGPEFEARFVADDGRNGVFFSASQRPGHFMFDLPAYIGKRLASAGVGAVDDLGRCTYAEEDLFYSYRRMTHRGESDYGRHLSAIALCA